MDKESRHEGWRAKSLQQLLRGWSGAAGEREGAAWPGTGRELQRIGRDRVRDKLRVRVRLG